MATNDRPLTLGEAMTLLVRYTSFSATDFDAFRNAMNQVLERIYNEGTWTGLRAEIDLTPYIALDGTLRLPYDYDSLYAVQVDRYGQVIYSQNLEYAHDGPGELYGNYGGNIVIDEGFRPTTDLLFGYNGTVSSGSAVFQFTGLIGLEEFDTDSGDLVGLTAVVSGWNDNNPAGASFGLANGSYTIEGSGTANGSLDLTVAGQTAQSSAAATVGSAGTIYILDTNKVYTKAYRHYKLTAKMESDTAVRGIVRRRFQYLTDDTDWIYPSNINALKHGLLAVCFEDQSDPERAQIYWEQCFSILSGENSTKRAGAIVPLAAKIYGMGQTKPMNFY